MIDVEADKIQRILNNINYKFDIFPSKEKKKERKELKHEFNCT